MMSQNIRDIKKMPFNTKFAYGKVLILMAMADNEYNQLKMAEVYRLFKRIELPSNERIRLLEYMEENERDIEKICCAMDYNLNDQEKNIVRFSLIKDLIIIMKADYTESNNEKEFLNLVCQYFNISDEQLKYFYDEYESDQHFFDNDTKERKIGKRVEESIARAAALGIPLTALYYSGYVKGFGPLGILSALGTLGFKKVTRKKSYMIGMITSLALGIGVYKGIRWAFRLRDKEKNKLKHMLKEEMTMLHEGTKYLLAEDIAYFSNRKLEAEIYDKQEDQSLNLVHELLKKTLATMEKSKPVMI